MNQSYATLRDKAEHLVAITQKLTIVLISLDVLSYLFYMENIQPFKYSLGHIRDVLTMFRTPLKDIKGSRWVSIPLAEWLEHTRISWPDELIKFWFSIDNELLNITIWENDTITHWLTVLNFLKMWWSSGEHVDPHLIQWKATSRYVEVIVTGTSKVVKGSKTVTEQVDGWQTWLPEMSLQKTGASSDILAVELLFSQLMAQQKGGALGMDIGENGQIAMTLIIPRADSSIQISNAGLTLSTTAAVRAWNKIVQQTVTTWIELGQQLLEILSYEFDYLDTLTSADKIEASQELNKQRERLVSMVQSLEDWMVRWSDGL